MWDTIENKQQQLCNDRDSIRIGLINERLETIEAVNERHEYVHDLKESVTTACSENV